MRDEAGAMFGFYYFEPNGDVLDYGLGLRPDLVGRGLGLDFFRAGLEFARERYRPRLIRLHVAAFNERAIKVYERAGFLEVGQAHALVRALGRGRVHHDGRAVVIEVAAEVREARAVVALETTLVAHGFPPGEGVAVGLEAEARVREAGAVPATIGVLDGRVRVGLSRDELERFDASARKVGPRDLAAAVAQDAVGATTVGGTLAVCRAAGITVMATGGLGGVHRGWTEHLDVSSDLGELARTRCIVVSSGVKSLLDVPATMEVLETLAVPVLGYPHRRAAALLFGARRAAGLRARRQRRGGGVDRTRALGARRRRDPARASAGREPRRRRAADRGARSRTRASAA